VRSARFLAVAAALILAGVTRPTFADSPVPAPDSAAAAVADPSSTVGAEGPSRAAPALADATPSAGSLALLRTRVGRRVVRVSVGEDDYKLSRARFEPSGVVFSPGGSEGMSLWAGEGDAPRSPERCWDRGWSSTLRTTPTMTRWKARSSPSSLLRLSVWAVRASARSWEEPSSRPGRSSGGRGLPDRPSPPGMRAAPRMCHRFSLRPPRHRPHHGLRHRPRSPL
jgi:hypothetical protein